MPWAAYDQPSRENNGGASTSGTDQTTVACRTSASASSRSSPSAWATWRHIASHCEATIPSPSMIRVSPAIRPASAPRIATNASRSSKGEEGGTVETTKPPSSTSALPTNPRISTLAR
jgi:hypothetical protein